MSEKQTNKLKRIQNFTIIMALLHNFNWILPNINLTVKSANINVQSPKKQIVVLIIFLNNDLLKANILSRKISVVKNRAACREKLSRHESFTKTDPERDQTIFKPNDNKAGKIKFQTFFVFVFFALRR